MRVVNSAHCRLCHQPTAQVRGLGLCPTCWHHFLLPKIGPRDACWECGEDRQSRLTWLQWNERHVILCEACETRLGLVRPASVPDLGHVLQHGRRRNDRRQHYLIPGLFLPERRQSERRRQPAQVP